MKVIDTLKKTKETLFSFELLPPRKGRTLETIYNAIDPLIEFNPLNINITYHQQESVYQKQADGSVVRKIISKRPGTVAIAAAINNKYKQTVVPHIICGGHTREETEDLLIDLHFLGLNNLLVLRGDPPSGVRDFIAVEGGHSHTNELVEQVMNLNQGIYLEPGLKDPKPTDFSVGVAGYPEKHFESPNIEEDLCWLKKKVDAGADYIVTQMFFNNEKFLRFREQCKTAGIDVPIVPGIKPITTLKDLELLPRVFHIDIPQELYTEARKCTNNAEAKALGIEWAIAQSNALKEHGVPAIHYYTIGISDNIRKIAEKVF
ncbi:MAG: methylenetetrahydrofolate reductase [NAD(P)H] [Bacteroidales bacterium]|nr:methylenetetrahydrofolate reductase [NAD(P)H] [Bacteroidales bacterium]